MAQPYKRSGGNGTIIKSVPLPTGVMAQVQKGNGTPDAGVMAQVLSTWRTEVFWRDGKRAYWNFRTGRNGTRRSRYGGRYASLPEERKQEYVRNAKGKYKVKATTLTG